ncbi:hypothetical protein [Olleya sp. Bg11-27]|uniref:hypothetical protein n=1 Tax=Olleya sp. Bg11-27 TaxID=2058135 RepID=UPI000C306C1D|nr:hypothetical protein [Olleya sp. Bg11-27]AUC77274.1 hypothetical protein CW732_16970 [Olleya sp. Bg11-27]
MNTRIFKIALVVIMAVNLSCKKSEAKLSEFKYADQPNAVACKSGYDDLLKEALYAFESDILNKYDQKGQNKLRAYRAYISNVISNRTELEKTVTPHTKAVFDVLKSKTELWDGNHLNYNSVVVSCILENMMDKGLKQSLNSLITTNSMRSELFAAPLRSSTSYARDTYLATFVALDLYYSKLNTVDFTNLDLSANIAKAQPIDFNKKPTATPIQEKAPTKEVDHTGHNHD